MLSRRRKSRAKRCAQASSPRWKKGRSMFRWVLCFSAVACALAGETRLYAERRFSFREDQSATGPEPAPSKTVYVEVEELDSSQDALLLRSVRTKSGRATLQTRTTARAASAAGRRGVAARFASTDHDSSANSSDVSESESSDYDNAYESSHDNQSYSDKSYDHVDSAAHERFSRRENRAAAKNSLRSASYEQHVSADSLSGLRARVRDLRGGLHDLKDRFSGSKRGRRGHFGNWRDWLSSRDWSPCDWPCNPPPCKPDPCDPDPCDPDGNEPPPAPEPSSIALGMLGLAAFVMQSRRQRRSTPAIAPA